MKLIVMRFGSMMGGHFIANCLALHPKILHMDKKCIQQKMAKEYLCIQQKMKREKDDTKLQSFAMSMIPIIRTLEINMHHEYSIPRCYGFHTGQTSTKKIRKLSNDVWHTVMNQNEFYPCFISGKDYDEFPNIDTVNIKAVGADWLVSERWRPDANVQRIYENTGWGKYGIKPPAELKSLDSGNEINCNMESIHEKQNFYNEILQLTTFLELEPVDKELLETLRQTWMHSIRIVHNGGADFTKHISGRLAIS